MVRRFVDAVEFELRMYSETANGIGKETNVLLSFEMCWG
jgi:hypothetical protein